MMTSQSAEGTSQITLQFDLSRSMDCAAQDVQAAINAAAGTLPANLPYPPTYSKVNPADAPILTLALTSDTLPIDVSQRRRRHAAAAETVARSTASAGSPCRASMRPAVRVQRRSGAARRLRAGDGGRAHRRRGRQRQRAEGRVRRAAAGVRAGRQRPVGRSPTRIRTW